LVERQGQGAGARGECVALTLVGVEGLSQCLDLGLGFEELSLRELVGLVEISLAGAGDGGLGLEPGELRLRGPAPLRGRLQRVLLP
jgi:hypothetical protein